jgi:hypothetical protein
MATTRFTHLIKCLAGLCIIAVSTQSMSAKNSNKDRRVAMLS